MKKVNPLDDKKWTVHEGRYRLACQLYEGFCRACGKFTTSECEPDTRGRECDRCGEHEVYGAEELVVMGQIEVDR